MTDHSIAVGWDVGGWNCDKNRDSRDALVILDAQANLLGQPWRGNLRQAINGVDTTAAFLTKLLYLCGVDRAARSFRATVAIDAPLAFPASLIELLTNGRIESNVGENAANPYLYRYTERRLASPGNTPLSVVKDMIGSQSTKAIHARIKFAPQVDALGVWSDGVSTRFIETYPAACRRLSEQELSPRGLVGHDDIIDAGVCALIGHRFMTVPEAFEPPPPNAPCSEGWIWLPKRPDPGLGSTGRL